MKYLKIFENYDDIDKLQKLPPNQQINIIY
jgi:hypothetical protein